MNKDFTKLTDEQLSKIVTHVVNHLSKKDTLKMAEDMFKNTSSCSIITFPDFFSMTKKERRNYRMNELVRYNNYFPRKVANAIKLFA